jgi:hypothetical protein
MAGEAKTTATTQVTFATAASVGVARNSNAAGATDATPPTDSVQSTTPGGWAGTRTRTARAIRSTSPSSIQT